MKYFIVVVFLVLFSCGGGGGSPSSVQPQSAPVPAPSQSSSPSNSSSTSTSTSDDIRFKIALTGLNISSSDDLAQLKLNEQTTSNGFDFTNFIAGKVDIFLKGFFPSLYAQVSTVKPIDLSQWEIITKKLVNGSLTDINPTVKVYEVDAAGKFLHRSDSNYLCFYLNSETNELSPNNDEGEQLKELRDANGNVLEVYVLDGTSPQYSNEALSCALNEVETSCDTSNLPIRIVKVLEADDSGSLIGRIEYAESFQEFENACTPNLTISQFLIKDSKVYPINDFCVEVGFYSNSFENAFVMKPNGPFNTTDEIIVQTYAIQPISTLDCNTEKDRYIRSLKINEAEKLVVKQLSPSAFSSINNDSTSYKWEVSKVAYNGTNLFLLPSNSSQITMYVFKLDGSFDIVRPDTITHTLNVSGEFFKFIDDGIQSSYTDLPLQHMGHFWYENWDASKSFSNGDPNFVFKEDGTLLIFSNGWAHTYDVESKTFSKVVNSSTWPPSGYEIYADPDGLYPIHPVLNNCPEGSANDLTIEPKLIGTRSLPTCMIFPNARGRSASYNTQFHAVSYIVGRWKNNIVYHNNGSWHPETFIYSGYIYCLPYRPTCQPDTATKSPGFFQTSKNYMFGVNSDKNIYTRYDMDTHTYNIINLDNYNYIPQAYEVSKDVIYVEVINANNSNKEYLQIDFATGTESFLGTISEDNRTVIEIEPLNI